MKKVHNFIFILLILFSCQSGKENQEEIQSSEDNGHYFEGMYVPFTLTADLSDLTPDQKAMLPILIEAAKIMDDLFWEEAYGKKDSLLSRLEDQDLKEFVTINYGPWDRLNNNQPFIDGIGEKPLGANFYPANMDKATFESDDLSDKTSLYTMIRRGQNGKLEAIPYHKYFENKVLKTADLLEEAASMAENEGLRNYLNLRAEALRTDDYQKSDLAWMDMTSNTIDVVIGPIETYEDKLFGYKAAHEAYVLIKDKAWSNRLERFARYLPSLQENLPVPDAYKMEKPGSDAQLNAYDVIYYAGDCNAGSKTIAINLPNDEEVQLKKGTRRLQLKNAMKAKFEKILLPIADELIAEDQLNRITFDAFFANTMFHEVAHGLGIKNTITGKGTVRQSLQEHASALEEGKADILGLYMIDELHKKGEIEGDLEDYYVTFLAGIFRSVRFGASTAHGKANMIRFNYFKELNAFQYDAETGKYNVDFNEMQKAVKSLSEKILVLQGDGDYAGAQQLVDEYAVIDDQLKAALDRLKEEKIPVDIIFNQGVDLLNL